MQQRIIQTNPFNIFNPFNRFSVSVLAYYPLDYPFTQISYVQLSYLLAIYWLCINDYPLLVIASEAYVLSLFKTIYCFSENTRTTCITPLENFLFRVKNNHLEFTPMCLLTKIYFTIILPRNFAHAIIILIILTHFWIQIQAYTYTFKKIS